MALPLAVINKWRTVNEIRDLVLLRRKGKATRKPSGCAHKDLQLTIEKGGRPSEFMDMGNAVRPFVALNLRRSLQIKFGKKEMEW